MTHAVVIAGVSGAGTTTIGELAAATCGYRFVDADDLHPATNRTKMASGIPLENADRAPWLDLVGTVLHEHRVVVACSALRRDFRDRLRRHCPEASVILLRPSFTTSRGRCWWRSARCRPSLRDSAGEPTEGCRSRGSEDRFGHEPERGDPMQKTSLTALARTESEVASRAASGRGSKTVYGGHEHQLRQTLIALRAGQSLAEHENPGEATVQVLSGRIVLRSGNDSWSGWNGDLIVLPQGSHSLEAVDDSVVLLTVVKTR